MTVILSRIFSYLFQPNLYEAVMFQLLREPPKGIIWLVIHLLLMCTHPPILKKLFIRVLPRTATISKAFNRFKFKQFVNQSNVQSDGESEKKEKFSLKLVLLLVYFSIKLSWYCAVSDQCVQLQLFNERFPINVSTQ